MSAVPSLSRWRTALVAALVAASAVAIVGPATGASARSAGAQAVAEPAVPTPPAIVWHKCTAHLDSYGAQCAFVTVPLDYDDPSEGTIKISISRILHTTKNYQGVAIGDFGGPGEPSLDFSRIGSFVPHGGGQSYDWIGFDPRGVGTSLPSIHCDPGFFAYDRPDYRADTGAEQRYWLNASETYSQDCASDNDLRLLDNMTTRDNAMDIDSIRVALGQKQITYYGYSYGTYLGQTYATLFPRHVRRMVLDSTVNADHVFYQTQLDQDVAFQGVEDAFFRWVARHDETYHLGTTEYAVSAAYYGVGARLAQHPGNGGKVGPDEWNDVLGAASYGTYAWPSVADLFVAGVTHHDFSGVTASIEGPKDDDNTFAVYLATQCTDAPWPSSYTKTWKPDAEQTDKTAPFGTWSNVWYNTPCITWPAPSQQALTIDGGDAPPILMIDEQYDGATPFSGSLVVRSLFPKASLVEVDGGYTHATTLFAGNTCTDDTIAAYLRTGALPARVTGNTADKHCAAEALPQPDSASAATASTSSLSAPGELVRR